MFRKSLTWIIIASLFMGLVALPDAVKDKLPGYTISHWLKSQKITLGLDLQGGTQLDYRIDLRNAYAKNEDEDDTNNVTIHDILEGVRATIERRVNGLGVSEPQIYTSTVAGEEHIIVELAGIKDVDQAKAIVGKTIQLEFKEPRTEPDPEQAERTKTEAQATLEKALREGADFEVVGENIKTSDGKIQFRKDSKRFVSGLSERYKNVLPKMKDGEVYRELLKDTEVTFDSFSQNIVNKDGLYIVKRLGTEMADRTVTEHDDLKNVANTFGTSVTTLKDKTQSGFPAEAVGTIWNTDANSTTDIIQAGEELQVYKVVSKTEGDEEVQASHILIAYKGAQKADDKVTLTKEGAREKAEELLAQAKENPALFGELAQTDSNDPSAAGNQGDLGFFKRGVMSKNFENAAFSTPVGQFAELTETEFGFHIIKVTDRKGTPGAVTVERVTAGADKRAEMETALKRVTEGYEVTKKEEQLTYNEILFDISPDPWKSTGLDGSHFRYASVVYGQVGVPQVNITFDNEGARMFEDLTGRLTNERLAIFVGGELISAPRVNEKITGGNAVITGSFNVQEALKLATDLNTGAIDAPIILSGQYTISATLGENALRVSLIAGIIGLIALALAMILYYRLLGVFAVIALMIYSVIMIFVLKISPIVMTLAGIAGIILSIGMAVDANILIFERTKEELNTGKNFSASVSMGFERAWSSIRDSNVSSLITCSILWFFGNSIIRGFALMLGLGILVSMFTAITVTRAFLHELHGTSLSKNRWLLGAKKILLDGTN